MFLLFSNRLKNKILIFFGLISRNIFVSGLLLPFLTPTAKEWNLLPVKLQPRIIQVKSENLEK